MAAADVGTCARIACASEIGARYGFEPESLGRTLSAALSSGGDLFVAVEGERLSGFAWAEPHGAFASAPYLRLIAVDESLRGSGLGSALLAAFEERTASVGRDWCLLVSDFNLRAQAFYARHGYRRVGELPGFAREGIAEVFMVKRFPRGGELGAPA